MNACTDATTKIIFFHERTKYEGDKSRYILEGSRGYATSVPLAYLSFVVTGTHVTNKYVRIGNE